MGEGARWGRARERGGGADLPCAGEDFVRDGIPKKRRAGGVAHGISNGREKGGWKAMGRGPDGVRKGAVSNKECTRCGTR